MDAKVRDCFKKMDRLTDAHGHDGFRLRGFDDAVGDEFGEKIVDVHLTKVVFWRHPHLWY